MTKAHEKLYNILQKLSSEITEATSMLLHREERSLMEMMETTLKEADLTFSHLLLTVCLLFFLMNELNSVCLI